MSLERTSRYQYPKLVGENLRISVEPALNGSIPEPIRKWKFTIIRDTSGKAVTIIAEAIE